MKFAIYKHVRDWLLGLSVYVSPPLAYLGGRRNIEIAVGIGPISFIVHFPADATL